MKSSRNGQRDDKSLALYIHIPFCVRKCLYCDFLSAPAAEDTRQRYVEALLVELRGRAAEYRDYAVTSVFFGGGTPSLLSGEQIAALLDCIRDNCRLGTKAEITMEVNPGTVNPKSLEKYRAAGVNRLSIGLQSADNGELERIGRIHTWEQFLDTYRWAGEAGFENLNVDLMSALPGQSPGSYRDTLGKVLALRPLPGHISAYSLIVEEGTPLAGLVEQGGMELPGEDADREMYLETREILEKWGYRRYEISNYAREGYECRHNCGYWRRKNYLGFGIGAASLMENVRFKNGSSLEAYLAGPLECREEIQPLSGQEQMEEFMFLGLRMTAGVSGEEFQTCFGVEMEEVYGDVIRRNSRDGLLRRYERDGKSYLALTERGLDLSNYVMGQFLLT